MLESLNAGSEFLVWLGSVAGGVSVLAVGLRWLFQFLDMDDQNTLIGDWFGYGFFHADDCEQFYREEIKVWRSWFKPWQLSMRARPCSTGKPTEYTGWIKRVGFYMYSYTKEGFRNDPCFEIGKLLLSGDHVKDKIVGLHLGGSYVSDVHVATAFVWSRNRLDPTSSMTNREPSPIERETFFGLCEKYFEMKPENLEFQLAYRATSRP
jgi:hypothetical protein